MRIWALVKRIIQQMMRDKRTLALLFVAPLFILTLMYFFFNDETTDPTLCVVDIANARVDRLEAVDIHIKHYDRADAETVTDDDLDGLLKKKDDTFALILENSDPSTASGLKMRIGQASAAFIQDELIDGQKDLLDTQKDIADAVREMVSSIPPDVLKAVDMDAIDLDELDDMDEEDIDEAKEELDNIKDKEDMDVTYVYGDEDTAYFDVLSP